MSNQALQPDSDSQPSTSLVVSNQRGHQLAHPSAVPSMAPPPQPQHYAPYPHTAPQTQPEPESVIALADIVGYLRRRWKLGFLVALPLAVLAFIKLGTGPKVFQAEAQVLLRIQDSNVFNFEQLGRSAIGELSAPLLVNNHLSEMKSRSFIEYFYEQVPPEIRQAYIEPDLTQKSMTGKIKDLLGLSTPKPPPNHREIFLKKIASITHVEPLKESFILRIQNRSESPTLCAELSNLFAQSYIDYVAHQELSSTGAASEFLTKKAADLRAQLQQSENRLAAYRQSASALSRTDGVKDTSGEKLQALNQALADTQVKLTRARYDLDAIEAAQPSQIELLRIRPVAENPQVTQKRTEISTLEAQLTPLLEFCGPRHPKIIGLNNEIRTRKLELNTFIASVVTMTRQEYATLQSQVEDFKRQITEARGDVIAMGDKEIQEKMLIDQVELDRQMYQNIAMRMNQANLTGEFTDSGLLRIADVATPPDRPLKPNKTVAAIAAMMVLGLVFQGLPIGWGLTDDHLIKHLRTPQPNDNATAPPPTTHPPATALPPAPPSPQLPEPPPPMALTTGNRTTVLAEFPALTGDLPSIVLAECLKSEPRGAATALRQLTGVLEKQSLYRSGPGGIILITSSEASEGKSLAAAALAATFVHHGRRVLVIDCHAGGPGLHHYFPQSEQHSSSASHLEHIRYGQSGLYVLPAHDIPAYETNELLDGYRAWIDRARNEVDWIILDGPPVLKNFADVAPLAPLATDVIMVHDRARATPAKLRAAMTLLQPMMSSSAMRGLVINRA